MESENAGIQEKRRGRQKKSKREKEEKKDSRRTVYAKCMVELMDAVEAKEKRKAREKEAKDTDIAVAYASCMVELLNGVVVKHSKQDAVKRYENLISEAVEAQGRNDAAKVYSCYKSLRPRKSRALNLVRKPDGENAKTPLEARKVWQGHWAKAVEAVIVEPDQIEEEARKKRKRPMEEKTGGRKGDPPHAKRDGANFQAAKAEESRRGRWHPA